MTVREGDHTLEKFRRQLERSFHGKGFGRLESTFPDWAVNGASKSPSVSKPLYQQEQTDNERANTIFPVASEESNAAEPLPWVFPFHQFPISPAAAGYVLEPADSHPKAGEPDPPTLDSSPVAVRPTVDRVEGPTEVPELKSEARRDLADQIYAALGLKHGTPTGDLVSWISHGLLTKAFTEIIESVADHYGLTRKETIALCSAMFFVYREWVEPDGLNLDSIMDIVLPAAVAAAEILWEER